MNDYAYQIKGALESVEGKFLGFQVIVCNAAKLDTVNVPITKFDKETVAYIEFRMKLTKEPMNIQRLPIRIQNNIRVPLGKYLDQWVLKNFYGHNPDKQDLNS